MSTGCSKEKLGARQKTRESPQWLLAGSDWFLLGTGTNRDPYHQACNLSKKKIPYATKGGNADPSAPNVTRVGGEAKPVCIQRKAGSHSSHSQEPSKQQTSIVSAGRVEAKAICSGVRRKVDGGGEVMKTSGSKNLHQYKAEVDCY